MVEEAAGTRMYETKRNESMKKIVTKESKVNAWAILLYVTQVVLSGAQLAEIERLIQDDIEPTLERLRKEQ